MPSQVLLIKDMTPEQRRLRARYYRAERFKKKHGGHCRGKRLKHPRTVLGIARTCKLVKPTAKGGYPWPAGQLYCKKYRKKKDGSYVCKNWARYKKRKSEAAASKTTGRSSKIASMPARNAKGQFVKRRGKSIK